MCVSNMQVIYAYSVRLFLARSTMMGNAKASNRGAGIGTALTHFFTLFCQSGEPEAKIISMKKLLSILVFAGMLIPDACGQILSNLLGNGEFKGSSKQTALPTNYHYAISLGWLPNFNPEKLSVCCTYGWKHLGDLKSNSPKITDVLDSYDYILTINGVPAETFENAEEAMKLASTPQEDGRVKIEYYSMRADTTFWVSYVPKDLVTIGRDESDIDADGAVSINQTRFNYINGEKGMTILCDDGIRDWSKYRRIAFQPTSDDPLVEREYYKIAVGYLMDSGFPFIYDEENPDLILTIAFDEDQQVTSTYIPPTTQYLDNGSRSYIYNRRGHLYVNSFRKPRTKVTSGGYTHRDIENRHFLEVSLLDAHRMSDSTQTAPPIVWQLRYSKQHERPLSLKTAAYKVLAGCQAFPGINVMLDPVHAWNGICWHPDKSIVTYVYKDSPAEALGLQPGDEILKIDGKNTIKFFQQGWRGHQKERNENEVFPLTFKNQSWFSMMNDSKMDPLSSYSLYRVPEVLIYYNEDYFDNFTYRFEPDIFTPGSEHEIEIKREGKKMKLYGPLYDKNYFFDATRKLPKVN